MTQNQGTTATATQIADLFTKLKNVLTPLEALVQAEGDLRVVIADRQREAAQVLQETAALMKDRDLVKSELANLQARYNDVRKMWDDLKAGANQASTVIEQIERK